MALAYYNNRVGFWEYVFTIEGEFFESFSSHPNPPYGGGAPHLPLLRRIEER
jgi:hypothetical protein